jgi:ubiquinone/menaquinone biosynthesis C-methylase UbiE
MTHEHADVTRRSFRQQTGLFTGEDALFAHHSNRTEGWYGPLDRGMVVLNVACGAAHVSEEIAPNVHQVVGVDLTPDLLALGSERLRTRRVHNVLLQLGDAADLPFVDDSFDLVVCRTALHHFPEAAAALAQMGRVCRPGGRVAVSDMVAPSGGLRARFDEVQRLLDPSHVSALLDEELIALVAEQVGPVTHTTGATLSFPLDAMMTDAADRDAVVHALRAELDGGEPTGFAPAIDDEGRIAVSFALEGVHSTPGR